MCVDRPSRPVEPTRPTVLIVDDDPLTQRLADYFMHRWGVDGDVVSSPEEAVAKSASRWYDLVLVDPRLLKGASPETALGACRDGCLGKIVFLTSEGPAALGESSAEIAAHDVVRKPITADHLREVFLRHSILSDDATMTPPPADDLSPLRSTLDDDEDMRELICEYGRALPSRLADLRAALQADDLGRVTKLAHQLKGAGGMYGYPSLSAVAALLEQAAKEGHQIDLLTELLGEATVLVDRIQLGLPEE